MKRTLLLFVLTLTLLLAASSASAFDGHRKGFVLGGGLGIGPLARGAVDGGDKLYQNAGFSCNILIGYAWDERNMIVYLNNVAMVRGDSDDLDNDDYVQSVEGPAWFHYFNYPGRGFFTTVCLGLQGFSKAEIGDDDSFDYGPGFVLGGGYEFTRHVQVFGIFGAGRTSYRGVDYNHLLLTFGVTAVAF